MYCIVFNNLVQKTIECVISCTSYKQACDKLINSCIKFAEENQMAKPITVWSSSEFDIQKIKLDSLNQSGHWMCCFNNKIQLYKKTITKSWFGYNSINLVGDFVILDVPEPVTEQQPNVKKSNVKNNYQHGCHVSMIDELKFVLGKRQTSFKCINLEKKTFRNEKSEKFINDLVTTRNKIFSK